MILKPIIAAAAQVAGIGEAAAEGARPWTVSTGFSRIFAGDSASGDASAFSLSLSRAIGDTTVGVSGGVSRRDALFPETVERSNGKSWSVGGSLGRGFDSVSASVSVDYAQESADFTVIPVNIAPFEASGRLSALSVSGAVSGVYGETTRLIPSVSGGWSRTRGELQADTAFFSPAFEQSIAGWSGSAGLFLAQDVGARVTLSGGAAAIFAEQAGALAITGAGARAGRGGDRFTGIQTLAEEGSVVYGEAGLGLSTAFGRVTFSLDATRSFGLEDDYFILSTGTSISF
jgi:hypothetical protein